MLHPLATYDPEVQPYVDLLLQPLAEFISTLQPLDTILLQPLAEFISTLQPLKLVTEIQTLFEQPAALQLDLLHA